MQFVYCSEVDSAVYGVGVQRWVAMNYVVWLTEHLLRAFSFWEFHKDQAACLTTAMLPILIFHMRKLRLKPLGTWYTGYTESNAKYAVVV